MNMLPLPGAPGSSWALYRSRLKTAFEGVEPRVCVAFWFFGMHPEISEQTELIRLGLINNVLYVIILSAALDLVGPNVPKGVVLLADVIPSFLVKLCAPYFIHAVPYPIRIMLFVALSTVGMLLIALTPAYTDGGTITTKMAGVVLASLSSGGGELSFLGLTYYFGPFSLAAWGSGTGGAGLVGAGAYALATTSLGLSVKGTLLASALLPVLMLISFFVVLPKGRSRSGLHIVKSDEPGSSTTEDESDAAYGNEPISTVNGEDEGLLGRSAAVDQQWRSSDGAGRGWRKFWMGFTKNLRRSRSLFIP